LLETLEMGWALEQINISGQAGLVVMAAAGIWLAPDVYRTTIPG
jgi:hypothetical protein